VGARVNFDPAQEIGPKVGGGCFFVIERLFVRIVYVVVSGINQPIIFAQCNILFT